MLRPIWLEAARLRTEDMTSTETTMPVATTLLSSDFLLAGNDGLLESQFVRIVAWILGLLVVLGTAWGASAISGSICRNERAKPSAEPPRSEDVFDEICTALGLPLNEKRQLLDGASVLNLTSPALLFVDSGLLNQLAAADNEDSGEFRKLADRLFPPDAIPSEADLAELTKSTESTAVV
jgi:hypothetical protein